MQNSPTSSSATTRRNLIFVIIAVMAVALVVFAVTLSPRETQNPGAAEPDVNATSSSEVEVPGFNPDLSEAEVKEIMEELNALATRVPDDPLAAGAVDAPVVLIVYSDFLCSFCGSWFHETLPQILDSYVADGDVRIEWRDLPGLGEDSVNAAIAARAAANQGKFWEYAAVLYDPEWQSAATSQDYDWESLAAIATGLGLDEDQFLSDLNDPSLEEDVNVSLMEAEYIGFEGTPGFIIGGHPLIGAQPFEVFEAVIDSRLEATLQPSQ